MLQQSLLCPTLRVNITCNVLPPVSPHRAALAPFCVSRYLSLLYINPIPTSNACFRPSFSELFQITFFHINLLWSNIPSRITYAASYAPPSQHYRYHEKRRADIKTFFNLLGGDRNESSISSSFYMSSSLDDYYVFCNLYITVLHMLTATGKSEEHPANTMLSTSTIHEISHASRRIYVSSINLKKQPLARWFFYTIVIMFIRIHAQYFFPNFTIILLKFESTPF